MDSFDNYATAMWFNNVLERIDNLHREVLLHLRSARVDFNHTWYLRQTNDVFLWKICKVHLAYKWQQMMSTETCERDVFHEDHRIVCPRFKPRSQYFLWVKI